MSAAKKHKIGRKEKKAQQASKEQAPTPEPEPIDATEAPEPEPQEQPELSREEQLTQELAELQERYQRLGAEYLNYQKRTSRQTEQAHEASRENVVRALLPVLDNFDHTLAQAAEKVLL